MFGKVEISLRTFSLLKGQQVYEEKSGKILGQVYDLCLNETGKVTALLMDSKGMFQRDRMIPIENVTAFGKDGIMVESDRELQPITKEKTNHTLYSHHGLYRKPLLTSEGEKLGLIEDVYFQEELGTIIGYEVTDGFFADITEGKKVVKTTEPLTIGKDVIVVNVKP
jgi:uncharacterized protein YrrD